MKLHWSREELEPSFSELNMVFYYVYNEVLDPQLYTTILKYSEFYSHE